MSASLSLELEKERVCQPHIFSKEVRANLSDMVQIRLKPTQSHPLLSLGKAEIYSSCTISRVDFKSAKQVQLDSRSHGKWVLNSTKMTDSEFTKEDIKPFHFL
jgi:hypothetical protein